MYEFIDKKEMGKRLTKLRGEKQQAIVAKAIDVTPSALANYEAGVRVPRDDVKARIANYYNTTIEHIFFTISTHET